MENEEIETHRDEGDTVIVVTMSKGDYLIMKDMIKDRKSTSYVWNKIKMFSLTLSGVIAAWMLIGDKLTVILRKLLFDV